MITIGTMTAVHVKKVAILESSCFHAPWSESALTGLLNGDSFAMVAESDDGDVLAYAGVFVALDEGQITNVATHPDHRRCGIADALLCALIVEAKKRGLLTLSLEVRESNEAAISLYRKHGFSVAGKRNGFYTHPRENALVMIFTL